MIKKFSVKTKVISVVVGAVAIVGYLQLLSVVK